MRDTTQMDEQGWQQYFAGLSLTVLSRERKAQSPDSNNTQYTSYNSGTLNIIEYKKIHDI